LLVLPGRQRRHAVFPLYRDRSCQRRMDLLPASECAGGCVGGVKDGYGPLDHFDGHVRRLFSARWFELYLYSSQPAYEGYEHAAFAADDLGVVLYRDPGRSVLPRTAVGLYPAAVRPSWRYELLSL